MATGDLLDKVSHRDLQREKDKANPPEFEQGFEPMSTEFGSDSFDIFNGGDDDFGGVTFSDSNDSGSFGGSSGSFGGPSLGGAGASPFGGFNDSPFGGFGDSPFGNSMGGFDNNNQQPPQKSKTDENIEKALVYSGESVKTIFQIMGELLKSRKYRDYDDWSLYSVSLYRTGAVFTALGIIASIIGAFGSIKFLTFGKLGSSIIMCGGLTVSFGLVTYGAMTLMKIKTGDYGDSGGNIRRDVPDLANNKNMLANSGIEESQIEFIGDDLDDMDFESMFASVKSDLEAEFSGADYSSEEDEDYGDSIFGGISTGDSEDTSDTDDIDFDAALDNVRENSILDRQSLYEVFNKFCKTNSPEFNDKTEIDKDSDMFLAISALVRQAIASTLKVDEDEIEIEVDKAEETKFCYIIKVKRMKKLNNIKALAEELENYFKSGVKDTDVVASVDISGNYFVAVITKGCKDLVTLGDCLKVPEVNKFILNENKKLPVVVGIDDYGNPILEDCKNYPSMLIAGKARSGKSWFIFNLVMCMALFNPPDLIQFCIIDPKGSNIFKTIGLLPHVCGVSGMANKSGVLKLDAEGILQVLDDVINKEAPRRKKLVADHRVDDIWALRSKGVNLPFLYIVIDEVVTLVKEYENNGKKVEFNNLIITIITQLPSLGIGIILVPHRSQGIIDKTTRTTIAFTAAIRADNDVIKETLGVAKWDRPLINPGETALKTASIREPIFIKGTALALGKTRDEDDLAVDAFIKSVAKAYYKMGVELPYMESLGKGYNRDEQYIKDTLSDSSSRRVQFDIDNFDED